MSWKRARLTNGDRLIAALEIVHDRFEPLLPAGADTAGRALLFMRNPDGRGHLLYLTPAVAGLGPAVCPELRWETCPAPYGADVRVLLGDPDAAAFLLDMGTAPSAARG